MTKEVKDTGFVGGLSPDEVLEIDYFRKSAKKLNKHLAKFERKLDRMLGKATRTLLKDWTTL